MFARRRLGRWLTGAAFIPLVSACGADPGDSAGSGPPDGPALYATHCAACHGADLRGTLSGPSLLLEVYGPTETPDQAMRDAVEDGVLQKRWEFGSMAPVAGLDDDEVTAIIAFIRAQQDG